MSINFKLAEKYSGILVLVSEEAYTDFYMTKNLIKGLENVEIKFNQLGINVPLANLFKKIVIIKGKNERSEIDKNYKAALYNWKAFFETKTETIFFDLSKFKNEEQLMNTLIHEIGHSIHVNFVTPDASNYITVVGQAYTDIINEFKAIKETIENNIDDDENTDELIEDAENKFYNFADFLDNNSESDFSSISSQICSDYENSKNLTPLSKVENMILSIMKHIPSEYGSYDEREFFAECFRQFVLFPSQLSLANRNMIINALTMSRAQGKELMRAHKLIKDYVRQILS